MTCIPNLYDINLLPKNGCTIYQSSDKGIISTKFTPGKYLIELWGANGGASTFAHHEGGLGGYVSGILSIKSFLNAYFCIGTKGGDQNGGKGGKGGFNGGGDAGDDTVDGNSAAGGGGGATDMRLSNNECLNMEGLKSRILIAAGGGGASSNSIQGHAGGLEGDPGGSISMPVPNQTYGYDLGKGESGYDSNDPTGGGGGGYYGGFSSFLQKTGIGGSGGSSFISGYEECVAITKDGIPSNTNVHFSTYKFTNGKMFKGGTLMPSPIDQQGFENIGHNGDGFVRITRLVECAISCYCKTNFLKISSFMLHIFIHS